MKCERVDHEGVAEDVHELPAAAGAVGSAQVEGVVFGGAVERSWTQRCSRCALGGSLEAFYFAFGDDDVVGIADLPDNATAAAFAMEISSSGRVAVSTTVLLTPDELDRSGDKKSGWRAPGA